MANTQRIRACIAAFTSSKEDTPTVCAVVAKTRCHAGSDRGALHLSFFGKRGHEHAQEATYTRHRGGVLLHLESLDMEAPGHTSERTVGGAWPRSPGLSAQAPAYPVHRRAE